MNFGEVLKEKRLAKGITLEQLSKRSGLSIVSICQYERGKQKPNLTNVQKLAKGLGCTFEELYKYYAK